MTSATRTPAEQQAFVELYALFDLFRTLGFDADDIYFVPDCLAPDGSRSVGLAVQRDGKQFLCTVGPFIDILDKWPAWGQEINESSHETRRQWWEAAVFAPNHVIPICRHLSAKGFTLPKRYRALEMAIR